MTIDPPLSREMKTYERSRKMFQIVWKHIKF